MNRRRDILLFNSGLLIGIGVGLCVGVVAFVASMVSLMHHMFIIGVQWSNPGFIAIAMFPIFCIVAGLILYRRMKRLTA